MYMIFGILLAAAIIFSVCCRRRGKRIIRRICDMSSCEKYCKLNELIHPWGFAYLPSQDILTSGLDAWQREFGYHALFDRTAPHFNMVFDCEPIYFDYQGRTWLIEFWKGQYGINTGGEIGVYYADSVVSPERYADTYFHSADDRHLIPLSMELYEHGRLLFAVRQCHWWLTGFCMGKYSEPKNLKMKISVTCPDEEMLCSLLKGLLRAGYEMNELEVCGLTVNLVFSVPRGRQLAGMGWCRTFLLRWTKRISQWKNRFFCRLYLRLTRPFTCTLNRLLYLYLMVPFAFRRMLCFKKNKKQKIRGKRKYRE